MANSIFSDGYGILTEVLISTRKEQGLTQDVVASRLAKPQSFIAKIEGAERRLDVIEFISLANAMNVKPDDLLSKVLMRLSI